MGSGAPSSSAGVGGERRRLAPRNSIIPQNELKGNSANVRFNSLFREVAPIRYSPIWPTTRVFTARSSAASFQECSLRRAVRFWKLPTKRSPAITNRRRRNGVSHRLGMLLEENIAFLKQEDLTLDECCSSSCRFRIAHTRRFRRYPPALISNGRSRTPGTHDREMRVIRTVDWRDGFNKSGCRFSLRRRHRVMSQKKFS